MASICLMLIPMLAAAAGKSPSSQRETSQDSRVMDRLLTEVVQSKRRNLAIRDWINWRTVGEDVGDAANATANGAKAIANATANATLDGLAGIGNGTIAGLQATANGVNATVNGVKTAGKKIKNMLYTKKYKIAEDFFWPEHAPWYQDTYLTGLMRKGKVALGLANDCTDCNEIEEEINDEVRDNWMHAQDPDNEYDYAIPSDFPRRESLTKLLKKGEEHLDEHSQDVHLGLVIRHLRNFIKYTPTQYTGSWR